MRQKKMQIFFETDKKTAAKLQKKYQKLAIFDNVDNKKMSYLCK